MLGSMEDLPSLVNSLDFLVFTTSFPINAIRRRLIEIERNKIC